ncbi:hypothetical protein BASA83_012521 [Batrachochytrium salamandrivorans]|nr:hypothetical protein BASA83_012521 [Batrachochytrium salamandrivorans]
MQPSSSASVLSAIASPLLRRYKSFTPGDLRSETQAQHYQHPSYSMAWRALSKCKMDNMLENKRSFMLLNGLFTKFSIHNPESHCILEKNSDDTFERAFLSPPALQLAFVHCRPMIILDACHLRSKYGGVVMSAVAHDGEGKIWAAAKSLSEQDTIKAMQFILQENKEAGAYLLRSDTTKWASAYFPTARYGTVTSNSAESMNSWLEPLCSGSHLNFFNNWLSKVSKLMFSRNKLYNNLSSEIPENIQRRFNENKRKGLQRQIHQFAEFGFEVVNQANGHKRIINLALKTCTCGKFQEYQFLCHHAAVVIVKAGLSPIHFMAASYYTASLQAIYSNPVTPVVLDDIVPGEIVLPPIITRRAGRPKSKRIRSRGETNFEDQYTCTVCGNKSHNRRTCSNKHVQLTSTESLQTEQIDISRRVEIADSQKDSLMFSTPALQSSEMSSKRIRTVACVFCGHNHYCKTPCRILAQTE